MARGGESGPVAVLWPDPNSDWRPIMKAAMAEMPELLVLGNYCPAEQSGPAIWLRCVIDGTIELPGFPESRTPIVYLPGIGRADLRAGDDCSKELEPIVEILYRGTSWQHPNGRAWSAAAFMGSPKGAGLNLSTDRDTLAAMLRTLDQVVLTPLEELRGRRLDASDFNRMAGIELSRDILRWMADPVGMRERLDPSTWAAFCAECVQELKFDPESKTDVSAAAQLGGGTGLWEHVWHRFVEAPTRFPGVANVLERARPVGELVLHPDRWPDINDDFEASLRAALGKLPRLTDDDARRQIASLEKTHGPRRYWVWATLGRSSFARALAPLADLAEASSKALGGTDIGEFAQEYAGHGWRADAGAIEALALAPAADEQIIAAAVAHLLRPWLDDSARAFQELLESNALPAAGIQGNVVAGERECIVYVDGLRYELGCRLSARLDDAGFAVEIGQRWAAIPTVTATAKPAVTPIASQIAGGNLNPDFQPMMKGTGLPADSRRLREAISNCGYQIVGQTLDIPLGSGAHGWTEVGEIDKHGHHFRATSFARQLELELESLLCRIRDLFTSGWEVVRLVTDHGWLSLPGGMPTISLPKHLTESRWARCAVLSSNSRPDATIYPWHWNQTEWFASPSGIACFTKNVEYAHGGLSIQECMIPEIRVSNPAGNDPAVAIQEVVWTRLRCHVNVDARGGPFNADLRVNGPDGESVTNSPKQIDKDGFASLVLNDAKFAGVGLVLVVTDADGRTLSQKSTRSGIDS